jgi:hypothetical protein
MNNGPTIFVEHLIYLFWSNVLKEAVNQGVKMVKHEEFWFFFFFYHSLIGHVLEYNPSRLWDSVAHTSQRSFILSFQSGHSQIISLYLRGLSLKVLP